MIGKKGTMLDVLLISIVLLVFGIVSILAVYIWDAVYTPITDMFTGAGNDTAIEVMDTVEAGFGVIDYIFLFVYFMLSMTPIIFAVFVNHHPIFIVLNIMIVIILFFVFPVLSNVMYEFWSQPPFAEYAFGGGGTVTFPIMTRIFQYLPLITSGFSVMLMVAMFAKRGGVGGGY